MKKIYIAFIAVLIVSTAFGQTNQKKYVDLHNSVINSKYKDDIWLWPLPNISDEFDSLYIRNLFPQDTVSNDFKLINDRWKWCWAGRGWPGLPLYHLLENVIFNNAPNPADRYISLQVNHHDTGVVDPPWYPYSYSMFPMKMDYSV